MRPWPAALVALAALLGCTAAAAESLRCAGGLVAEGDSRLSVAYKCGEPVLRDTSCEPVYVGSNLVPVPDALAFNVPCQPVDEWLYDRGPGNLIAKVRFRAGAVRSITYGRAPR